MWSAEAAKLEKFYSGIVDVRVTITEEGRLYKVDLVVNAYAHIFKSSGQADKTYPASHQAMTGWLRSSRITTTSAGTTAAKAVTN